MSARTKPLLAASLFIFLIFLAGCIYTPPITPPTPSPFPTIPPLQTPSPAVSPTATPTPFQPGVECVSDLDCVPSECCHPEFCVRASNAPDCMGVACTMECRSGTLDCGNGRCVCIGGRCGVSWIPATPAPTPSITPIPTPTPYYFARCYETDPRTDFYHRGVSSGEYNGRFGLWEDSCSWNGTDAVLREYYCVDASRSPQVDFTEKLCLTQCYEGACDDACVCGAGEYLVCGMDNKTYRSECFAICAGTTVQMAESCPGGCAAVGGTCATSTDCCSLKCAAWNRTCIDCLLDSDCGSGKTCSQGRC